MLAFLYAFCLLAQIPNLLWQTDKTKDLSMRAIETSNTWVNLNPEFSCFLLDDRDIELYIQKYWPSDYLEMFRALPIGTMKADLWRYLVIASEGGVYSDIDSVCLKPIREWPWPQDAQHVLLIDLDCDPGQFCQWTFAATPRHPAMLHVCYFVLQQWKKRGIFLETDGKIDVLRITGPKIFTKALKSYLGEPLDRSAGSMVKQYFADKGYRKRINQFGIFFTNKGFFSGEGSKNLFWGSWAQ